MLAARFWTTFLALSFTQVALVCAQLLNHPAPPHIVSPRSGDTWTVGEVATVKWDLHGIQLTLADGVTPVTGFLVLGQLTDETESGFHLWADQQLASSFLWRDGQVQVVVPKVPSGSNYFLMLERINNQSQLFTIKNPEDPNGTGAIPSSLSISTLASSTTNGSATAATSAPATSSVATSSQSSTVPPSSTASAPLSSTSPSSAPSSSGSTSGTSSSAATTSISVASTIPAPSPSTSQPSSATRSAWSGATARLAFAVSQLALLVMI